MVKPCGFCGTDFAAVKAGARYCCCRCAFDARAAATAARNKRTCEQCGVDFCSKSRSVKRATRFCSKKCAADALRHDDVTSPCLHCGKMVTYSPARRPNFKYCSHKCWMEASRGILYGVVVHGKAPRDRYGSSYWIKQAGRVRKRDGYTCQDCGRVFAKGQRGLQVHHKLPVRLGGSDHQSNLVSLCLSCHVKADRKLQLSQDKCFRCGKQINVFNESGFCADCFTYSPQHLAKLRAKRKEAITGPRQIVGKTAYHCLSCGAEFTRQRTRVRGENVFCSRKCYQDKRCGRL